MIEISKELLSEVLAYDVEKYTIVSTAKTTQIRIWKKDAEMWDYRSYDIHHLAHKCKEWAFKQDYSYLGNKGLINIYSKTGTMVAITDKNVVNWFGVYIDFKACEWILKEINNE